MAKKEQKSTKGKEFDEKLDALDKELDAGRFRKLYKAKLIQRINSGEVGLIDELEKLRKLEETDPHAAHFRPEGESEETEDEPEYGIPDKLRVKRRPYTMSDAAKAQRANLKGKSRARPGNKNAWKHGKFSQGFIRQLFRPCLSTCAQYPCAIVEAGKTDPGEICMDKVQFMQTLEAINTALKSGKLEDFKELAAIRIAGGFEVIQRLISDILEDGTVVKSEKWDKDGKVLGYELKNHPALPFLAKLYEVLNLSPQDFMLTPLVIRKMKTEGKKVKTLADLMSGISIGRKEPDEEEEP